MWAGSRDKKYLGIKANTTLAMSVKEGARQKSGMFFKASRLMGDDSVSWDSTTKSHVNLCRSQVFVYSCEHVQKHMN